jgi:hypothetical protein
MRSATTSRWSTSSRNSKARQLRPPTASAEATRSTRPRNPVPTKSDSGPRGRATPGNPAPPVLRLDVRLAEAGWSIPKAATTAVTAKAVLLTNGNARGALREPERRFCVRFYPLVRKWAARPKTRRLEAGDCGEFEEMEPGAHRDNVPGPAAGQEQIHPAPSSRVARWLRCGGAIVEPAKAPCCGNRGAAGSLFLARRERHFLPTVGLGTPRCALSARATDARQYSFRARARTANEGRGGE